MLFTQLEALPRDLRHAARGLLRSPTFTIAALSAMALGVGAGTAVFSVVDRILFRALPYEAPDRLVSLGMAAPIVPNEFLLGYDYLDWRDRQAPFEAFTSWAGSGDCDLNDVNPVRLRCAAVDVTFLPALGIHPLAGRNFTREENQPKAPKVALLSYSLWRGRFGADPGAIGKTIPLDGQPARIVGVLPPHFELPTLESADILVPLALDEAEQRTRRTAILVSAIGRLKPGLTQAQALASLQPLFQDALNYVSPEFRKEVKLRMRPLRDRQIQDARLAAWILMGSVFAVLLIACANMANLLLARSVARRRELAVRAALGAGRGPIVRYALIESLLLGLTGGAASCLLAYLLLRFFAGIAPEGIPHLQQAAIDGRVLLFALAVSIISSILFGLAPALQDPRAELLAGSRTIGACQHLFRQILVTAQICVSLILLTGAGLLLRSLWTLQNQPLGMRADDVLTAGMTLGQRTYADPARRLRFFEELETRLRQLPGVSEAALTDSLPPDRTFGMMYAGIDVQGRPRAADPTGGMVAVRSVTPSYFAALRIPILRGRGFDEPDRDPAQNVTIISDALARRMFPGDDPVGKQIRPGRVGPWLTIIGVAANVRNSGLVDKDDPEYYVVRKHSPEHVERGSTVLLRTTIDPRLLAEPVRKEIAALAPTLPVEIRTLDQQIGRMAERPRFNALLLGLFAAMGLLLAAVGIYGVISFLVTQRTREIGIRMALGATPAAIGRLMLGHAALWTATGAILGVIGSLLAARLLRSMLFRVPARDPWTLAAAVAVLLAAALLAAWLPSRHAAGVDPVQALRQE
jgi:putative ABC transport system permease protein